MQTKIKTCGVCGENHPEENTQFVAGILCCNNCAIPCGDCGRMGTSETRRRSNLTDLYYCETCYQNNFVFCTHCDQEMTRRHAVSCDNGDCYHSECYDDCFHECVECGTELFRQDADYIVRGGDVFCTGCVDNDDEYDSRVSDYGYKPSPIFFNLPDEVEKFYMGIELEVECIGIPMSITVDKTIDIGSYLFCKEDGSLSCNGVEIVSHPATFDWLNENFDKKWMPVLDLRKQGLKSFKTGTCGIHIHMSRNAFSMLHLYKFMAFFYQNKKFVEKISQRGGEGLDRWAQIDGRANKNLAGKAKGFDGTDKYTCLNLTPDTVECRIFKGNLDPSKFKRNYEFLHALYMFTRECSLKKVQSYEFLEYVCSVYQTYPNLHKDLLNWYDKKTYIVDELPKIKKTVADWMDIIVNEEVVGWEFEIEPETSGRPRRRRPAMPVFSMEDS